MDDFYCVLPSNAKEENTASKFTTQFDRPIEFDNLNLWEVGLVEINFRNTIKTILKNDSVVIKTKQITVKTTRLGEEFQYLSEFELREVISKPVIEAAATNSESDKKDKILLVQIAQNGSIMKHDDFEVIYKDGRVNIKKKSEHALELSLNKYDCQVMGISDNVNMNPKEKETIKLLLENDEYKASYKPKLIKNKLDFGTKEKLSTFSIVYKDIVKFVEKTKYEPKIGSYSSSSELIKELNSNDVFKTYAKFNYNEQLNRCEIMPVNKSNLMIELKNGLNDVLGFTKSQYLLDKKITGELEIALLRGISSIFIYCDCCESIRVGNTLAPLLRNVSFPITKYGDIIQKNYQNPMYVSVNKTFIDCITIMICDAAGDIVPFVEGLTTCILHFRRK